VGASKLDVENNIVTAQPLPDLELIAAEIGRLEVLFNQRSGVIITADYTHSSHRVTVSGTLRDVADRSIIAAAFEAIPEVKSVWITFKSQPFPMDSRIYFPSGVASLNPEDMKTQISPIQEFLTEYPEIRLKIVKDYRTYGSQWW